MKRERRHELQQNLLADWLARMAEKAKPYANFVLLALVVVLMAVLARVWWTRQANAAATEAWNGLLVAFETGSPSGLDQVAEQFSDTDVAPWANVLAGDFRLAGGCGELFKSRSIANEELRKAAKNYMMALEANRSPELRERATFGLARAYEAQGELGQATETYERVVTRWPKGAYAEAAKQRLADLKRPVTKEFYDRFAKFDPKPAFSSEPGTPGQRPDFDLNSLSEPKKGGGAISSPKADSDASKSSKPGKPAAQTQSPSETKVPAAGTEQAKPPEAKKGDAGKRDD